MFVHDIIPISFSQGFTMMFELFFSLFAQVYRFYDMCLQSKKSPIKYRCREEIANIMSMN